MTAQRLTTTRLALRKERAEERICNVISSPCLAEAEARFQISSEVHLYYVVSGYSNWRQFVVFSANQIRCTTVNRIISSVQSPIVPSLAIQYRYLYIFLLFVILFLFSCHEFCNLMPSTEAYAANFCIL